MPDEMFAGTEEQFRNPVGVAGALNALDRRDVWLVVSAICGRQVHAAASTRMAAAARQWLAAEVNVELLDEPGIPPPSMNFTDTDIRVIVRVRRRAVEFRSAEFPLVANPVPWTTYYELAADQRQ